MEATGLLHPMPLKYSLTYYNIGTVRFTGQSHGDVQFLFYFISFLCVGVVYGGRTAEADKAFQKLIFVIYILYTRYISRLSGNNCNSKFIWGVGTAHARWLWTACGIFFLLFLRAWSCLLHPWHS